MEKSNENRKSAIIGIIIGILLCVIGICTYIVVNKIVEEKENKKETNNNSTEEIKEEAINELTLEEVTSLVNKYKYNDNLPIEGMYITSLDEAAAIALKNLESKKTDLTCEELFGEQEGLVSAQVSDNIKYGKNGNPLLSYYCSNYYKNNEIYVYEYNDVVEKYKELFKEYKDIDKGIIHENSDYSPAYIYSESKNVFVYIRKTTGISAHTNTSKVNNYKYENNKLIVEINNIVTDPEGKETMNNKYEYVFEITNNEYKLEQINKI